MAEKTSRSYFRKANIFKPLRAFCATARSGSMSRAAEELFLSQPAISLQIRNLEQALGTTLFERHGPKIRLTTEGQTLYQLANPLIQGLVALPEAFETATGKPETGVINVAAGESTILYILPDLVAQFRQQYPGIHVHLHNVTGKDGLAMIREEEVDFAIGSMIEVPGDIRYEPIYQFKPMLITAKGHPLAAKKRINLHDIGPYGLILPPKRLTTWRIVDFTFQRHEVPYHVELEVGGWEVIKRYVALDMGISIVTSICLDGKEELEVRDMSRYFPGRSYGLVLKRGRFFSPQAKRFINLVRAHEQRNVSKVALQNGAMPPSLPNER